MQNIYNIRLLELTDYENYLNLLEELTIVHTEIPITFEDFSKQFETIKSKIYVIIVDNKIIGSGSIFIEPKFVHNLSSVGHIEDIVITKEYRKYGYGKILVEYLIEVGKLYNVYKIILNCNDYNIPFYNKCGFIKKDNGMALYLD